MNDGVDRGERRQGFRGPWSTLGAEKEGLYCADGTLAAALSLEFSGQRIVRLKCAWPFGRWRRENGKHRDAVATTTETPHDLLHDDSRPRTHFAGEGKGSARHNRAHHVDDLDSGLG